MAIHVCVLRAPCGVHRPVAGIACWLAVLGGFAYPTAAAEDSPAQAPLADQVAEVERLIDQLREAGKEGEAERHARSLRSWLDRMEEDLRASLMTEAEKEAAELEENFEKVQQEIERLRGRGGESVAAELADRLNEIRRAVERGEHAIPTSDEPEVHWITLARGSTLPDELAAGTDRFTLGYAEVHVRHTARPVILTLTGSEPILWKIDVAEGARIHAVVLASDGQQVTGLDDPLVLRQRSSRDDEVRELTGRRVTTKLSLASYNGEPIVIGPVNGRWLVHYLQPELDSLMATARHELRRLALPDLATLRFEAIHIAGTPHSSDGPGFSAASRGEFTIAGPIASTLVPLPSASLRHLVEVGGDEPMQFGISQHYQLVFVDGDANERDLPKVPLGPQLRGGFRFKDLAYDGERHRLVMASRDGQSELYAYDLATSDWSKLAELDTLLASLLYVPDEDFFYAVALQREGIAESLSHLLRIAADGTVSSRVPLGEPLTSIPFHEGDVQLVYVQGRLVVLLPRFTRDLNSGGLREIENSLHVIDPASGEVVYSGPSRPQAEPEVAVPARTSGLAPVDGDGLLAKLDKKFARAARDVALLREAGETQRAADLAARLQEMREARNGQFAKRAEPRLYVVGQYGPGETTVRVTDSSGPVVLAVSSYEPVTWNIDADPGVELKEIIVGGYHEQVVKRVPPGVPAATYSHDQRNGGFYTYNRASDGHEAAAARLKELTGLEIAVLTPVTPQSSATVYVGPEDGQWRAEQVLEGLDRIIAEANVEATTAAVAALRKHRFLAVHHGQIPWAPPQRGQNPYVAQFTIDGPVLGTASPLSIVPENAAADPVDNVLYVTARNQLWKVDARTGAAIELPLDVQLRRRPGSGLAVDTTRRRLLLSGESLIAYDLATQETAVLRRSRLNSPGRESGDMVYAADEDVFYTAYARFGHGQLRALQRYNAAGALLDWITLAKPIRGSQHPFGGNQQLVYFANHLAILNYELNRHRPPNAREGQNSVGRITVVDLATGAIVYEGQLAPHVERRDLAPERLQALWEGLAREPSRAEELIWELAGGYGRTVDFLRGKLLEDVPAADVDLRPLVRDLDSNTFAVRDAAYKKLQDLGSRIVPELQRLPDRNASAEVRASIQALVRDWESGKPQNGFERQHVGGVEALARIGTPAARELLRKVAEGLGRPVVARAAKIRLGELEARD